MSFRKLSQQASDFMKKKKHRKGTYSDLQKTAIWANAKLKLIDKASRGGKLYCHHCHKEIMGVAVMHHTKYLWNDLFNPKYIRFLHNECHQRVHMIKRNYRRKNYGKKK